MRLVKFDGGLNLAKAPHLISFSEATESVNVDYEAGIITPLPDSTEAGPPQSFDKKYMYYWFAGTGTYEDRWQYEDVETEWLEYQERLYWTSEGLGLFTYNDSGVAKSLTIPTPITQPFPLEVVEQQYTPREVMISSVPAFDENAPELAEPVYLPFMDPEAGDWPPAVPGNGRDYAFVNRTDTTKAPSEPQYHTFLKDLETVNGGYDIETRIWSAVPQPTTPATTPQMDLLIYRRISGRWVFITGLLNANSVPSTFLDNVYDGDYGAPIVEYLVPQYSVTGTYTYAVSEYDPTTGAESGLYIYDELNLVHSQIWIERNLLDPTKQYRLYRVGGNLSQFTLVGLVTYNPAPGIYFKDTFRDEDIAGAVVYSSSSKGTPPVSIRYITELNAMFFAADGDKLRFTPIGEPTAWPELFFIDFPAPITGIGKTSVGLLVFTAFETWLITGNSPATLAQNRISGSQGCMKHHTIAYTRNACLWLSRDGLCTSSGASVVLQTRSRLGKLTLDPLNAVLIDESYYLLTTDSKIFKADFVFSAFSYIEPPVGKPETYRWLALGAFSSSDPKVTMFALSVNTITFIVYRSTLLNGSARTLKYKTGKFIGPGLTVPKVYKEIKVFLLPPMKVTVYSGAGTIAEKEFFVGQPEDMYTVYTNSDLKRGFWLQLEFEGLGTVYEVDVIEAGSNG